MKALYLLLLFPLLSTAPAELGQYKDAMWLLKAHEGLVLEAYWDVSQYTIGWGTPSYKGERITVAEADRRVLERYEREYLTLRRQYPKLDKWTARVVAIARYNVGSFGPRMQKALASGDKDRIAKMLAKYNRVAGKVHPGIVRRRQQEVDLLYKGAWATEELRTRDAVVAHIKRAKN